jgi:tetratricopeptide (TPR) repeat protein
MKTKFCLLVTLSVFLAAEKSVADPPGSLYCAKNHQFYANEAAFIAGCEGGGGGGGGGYSGPSQAEIAAQNAAIAQQQAAAATAAAQKQREDEAQAFIQQGNDAYNRNDYEMAIQYFQDALDKIPVDSSPDDSSLRDTIQTYIQKAKDAIAAKKQREQAAFDKSKQEGLSQLRGLAQGGGFDSGTGLKGLDSTDSGLKGLGDNSSGLKTLPDVNTDPMVVDARNVPSGLNKETTAWLNGLSTVPGVADRLRKGWEAYKGNDLDVSTAWLDDALNHDPNNQNLKYVVDRMHAQKKLADNPNFVAAVDQAVATVASGNTAGESAAIEKIKQSEGVLQLPTDDDMKYLFPNDLTPAEKKEQIRNGLALPEKDSEIDDLLKEHPELQPQVLAAWKQYRDDVRRIDQQFEDEAMTGAATGLAATAARLGLPYGHIEETVAKDPNLNAQWHDAIEHAVKEVNLIESGGVALGVYQLYKFDDQVQQLRRAANQPTNPFSPYGIKN